MSKAFEILLAALLLALASYIELFMPDMRLAPFDLPGELSHIGWPRDLAALMLAFIGLHFAVGSWAGYPELRPALVATIVLAQLPTLCAVLRVLSAPIKLF